VRLLTAALLGAVTAVLGAVVLGDYPLSGSVPWLAAILIPFLIGAIMVIVADGYETSLWIVTGPLGATSVAWGVRISTGWGLDPVPASAWGAVAVALVWPPCWAAVAEFRGNRSKARETPPAEVAPAAPVLRLVEDPEVQGPVEGIQPEGGSDEPGSAGDRKLRDLRHVGRPEVGDP
jgi:hypothetical protein